MSLLSRIIYNSWVNALLRPFTKLFYQLSGKELMSVSGNIRFSVDSKAFYLHTNQTCYVTKNMFYNGLDAYEYNWLFSNLAENARCFLDVGANIGLYTVMAAKINPAIEIHAFEPGKGAVYFLRKNISLNQISNVTVHEFAMSDQDAQLEFHEASHPKFPWLLHNLNGSSSLQDTHGRLKTENYKVAVCRLSTFLKQNNVMEFDLIKLDTEHNEHLILADSSEIFKEKRPLIMIEIYPEIAGECQETMKTWSEYYYYQVRYPKLIEISLNDLGLNQEFANYLLVPKEKISWINRFVSM
jgi:FkbM family methyltransferase